MKTLTRTSIMLIVVAGFVALMAGTAIAAPAEMLDQDWQHEALVDQITQLDEGIFEHAVPMIPQPGDEGVDDGGADDGGADDGGTDDGGADDGGADTPGIDEGGDDGGQDTPATDGDGDDTVTPPADNSDSGNQASTSTGKLPNTGTSLTLLVAFALVIAGAAYVARRAASKRVR